MEKILEKEKLEVLYKEVKRYEKRLLKSAIFILSKEEILAENAEYMDTPKKVFDIKFAFPLINNSKIQYNHGVLLANMGDLQWTHIIGSLFFKENLDAPDLERTLEQVRHIILAIQAVLTLQYHKISMDYFFKQVEKIRADNSYLAERPNSFFDIISKEINNFSRFIMVEATQTNEKIRVVY